MANKRQHIVVPREVLLVEIERHCPDTRCNARTRLGLTKAEAQLYDGFECEACERRHADGLTERDIPDWWEELTITGLGALRTRKLDAAEDDVKPEADEMQSAGAGGGVVARLSAAWQSEAQRGNYAPDDDDEGDE